tara:strand:+ start:37 stop:204 length:168 start_codon:yes stop_codon:yes gene_type:complete
MSLRVIINISKNKNKYIANAQLTKNCLKYLFFKNNLDILVNSIKESVKTHIDTNK